MLRPNLGMDAPPAAIEVGGASYPIDVDYRTWAQIQEKMRELYAKPADTRDALHNLKVIYDMQAMAFGGVLKDEDPYEALAAMTRFLAGYPAPPENGAAEPEEAVVSFGYDLNYIIIAIRNQGGPDLSYRRREPFHWWEFLLEFQSLCGEHHILRLMEMRGYKDESDMDAKKANRKAMGLKRRYALPYEMTADERRMAEEFDRMTEGR
ncbi:MAG: Gp15 family bacteriophage protein [Clostridia bacterium]|nr:Gp15 family bacteriophage protein [Clostridia bacterium]